ncbi:MAG: plasmid pRiA4b ORF-3 family protein [Spirochaetia bacterium]|jgi:hypothetical protein|nr:plasmid pRiA4b ORF-3 family protein [Spirochaetia bacterium]
MAKKTQLKKKVDEFILNRGRDFHFADIAGDSGITGAAGFSEKALLDILETNGLVFSRDFNAFKPRHLFFRGARFIVSPTEEETKNRILIPGHRFMPFCGPLTFPWDCVLLAGDVPVPQKTARRTTASLLVYYTLLGQENLPKLLMEDDPANEKILRVDGLPLGEKVLPFRSDEDERIFDAAEFSVRVFDFAALFREWGFSFGDGLVLEVKDWTRGIFSVEHLAKKRRRELMERSAEWIAKLEKGFLKTFDDLGLDFPIAEQVAYAYYYAGVQILKDPPLHLGGFIDSSAKVNIVAVGLENRLWYENRIDAAALGIDGPQAAPTGASGSLDAIFQDLHVALTETEVEAYMRDELFQRKENPDAVLERIFQDRAISFFSDDQMNDFNRYFKKLWNRVKKNYNYFADQLPGKVRARILDLFDRHYVWMQTLETYEMGEQDLAMQEITSLTQAVEFLEETLGLLNQKSVGREEEIQESLELLPQIEELIEELHMEITDKLEELPQQPQVKRQGLYLVKNEDAPSAQGRASGGGAQAVYVLRISLLYITPQIWRSFQVPGSYSLAELHELIQDVMGWESYHAHSFQIDGELYGPLEEEFAGFEPDHLDEEDAILDHLDLKEKQKFQYTYDFGDSWLHQLTVTKIIPASGSPAEDLLSPRCLGGKRACPPEDCGGVGGYEDILEALKAPDRKKHRELLDWLGKYDPEAFDMDAVNEIFQKKV